VSTSPARVSVLMRRKGPNACSPSPSASSNSPRSASDCVSSSRATPTRVGTQAAVEGPSEVLITPRASSPTSRQRPSQLKALGDRVAQASVMRPLAVVERRGARLPGRLTKTEVVADCRQQQVEPAGGDLELPLLGRLQAIVLELGDLG